MDIEGKYDYYGLTPVEFHDRIYLKRDDLYRPRHFVDFGITGGKVRQCLYLVESNLDFIRETCGGTIATAASVFSPQATIVSRVAKEFGLQCIIGVGTEGHQKHRAMQICHELGAEMLVLSKTFAFNNVLYSRLAELNKTRPFFPINFGYQATTNPEAIIEMNAHQVRNLPDDLDMLVINVGSGVSSAGILTGVRKYKPYLLDEKKVHLVQPFGHDRMPTISKGLEFGDTVYYHTGNYAYHKPLHIDVGSVHLDEIYEAKAYDWMVKNLPIQDKKVCYWMIGDSNILRQKAT